MNKREWIQMAMLPRDYLVNIHDIMSFTEERLKRVKDLANHMEDIDPTIFDDHLK